MIFWFRIFIVPCNDHSNYFCVQTRNDTALMLMRISSVSQSSFKILPFVTVKTRVLSPQ